MRKIGQDGSVMTLHLEAKAHLTSRGETGTERQRRWSSAFRSKARLNFEERDGFERRREREKRGGVSYYVVVELCVS